MPTLLGRKACDCMVKSWPMIEDRLVRAGALKPEPWMIAQGAYSSGSLSADTHAGGGAMDIWWLLADTDPKVRALRSCGLVAWPRNGQDSPKFGGGNMHCHMLWYGCPHLSAGAASQVRSFKNGRDGLIQNRPDRYRHLNPRPLRTWQQALAEWQGAGVDNPSPVPPVGDTTTPQPPKVDPEELDMKVTDPVPNVKTAGGESITLQQAAARAQSAYERVLNVERSLARIEATVDSLNKVLGARTSPNVSRDRLDVAVQKTEREK